MYRFNSKFRRIDWLYNQYAGPSVRDAEHFVTLVNRAYYKHSIDLYHERYVHDISIQYQALFGALGLKNRSDLVIVDVGGGTGFEYDQFVLHGIQWNRYFYIEPDQGMANTFEAARDLSDKRVTICCGALERFVKEVSDYHNKVIILSSCLHHMIWIERFLDHARQCMRVGDLLLLCHEPNNGYFLSPLMILEYFMRSATTDVLPRKMGIWKSTRMRADDQRWKRIDRELTSAGVTNGSLKPTVIRRMIDYGVATHGDWNALNIPSEYDEGHWTPRELADYLGASFKTLYLRTYRHLGDPGINGLIRLLGLVVERACRRWGSVMCLALQRTS